MTSLFGRTSVRCALVVVCTRTGVGVSHGPASRSPSSKTVLRQGSHAREDWEKVWGGFYGRRASNVNEVSVSGASGGKTLSLTTHGFRDVAVLRHLM
jgi:hypothetical protein